MPIIEIAIPKIYHPIAEAETPLAVEHAPLHTRIPETLMALLVSNGGEGIFVTTKTAYFKHLLKKWGVKHGIFLMHPRTTDIPFHTATNLVITEAHLLGSDVSQTLLNMQPNARVCGHFASRTHWFYQWARRVTLLRYPAAEILKEYPQQVPSDVPKWEYRRQWELEDVLPKPTSFPRFARERLWITTDRREQDLNLQQTREASREDGTPIVAFHCTPLQKRYLAMKRLAIAQGKKPRFLLLKYRRGGFTTLEQGESYKLITERPQSQVITLAHTAGSTQRIFRIVERFHDYDPRHPRLATDSKTQLELSDNGSLFFVGTAGGHGVSRGDTLQRVHGSEVSKWCRGPRQSSLVDDLMAGLLGACSHGEIVLETTPDGYEWFAATYTDAKRGLNDWVPIFLPWFVDPINWETPQGDELETLTDDEKNLINVAKRDYGVTITAKQIAFRRAKKREFKRLFSQEYPEDDTSCFLTTGTAFFDIELAMKLNAELESAQRKSIPGGYIIEWEPPIKGEQYVCGADTSEGLPGGDPNGSGILHRGSGRQVASLHGRFRPTLLAEHTVALCKRYNYALLGVERNNHGHSVIQRVQTIGGPKYNTAHDVGGSLYQHRDGRFGWPTDSLTRDIILDDLHDYMTEHPECIKDKDFLQEVLTFKLQHNGKFEADPQCHDDTIFKWGIARQMLRMKPSRPRIC